MAARLEPLLNGNWRFAAHLGIARPDAPLLAAAAASTDPVDQIVKAAKLGFVGVTDNGLKMRPPEVQFRMGKALRDYGMVMGSFTHNFLAQEAPFFWGEPILDMKAALAPGLAAAERVGGGCINAVLLDSRAKHADQWGYAADNLATAALLAAEQGVGFAVEAVSRSRVPTALIEGVADVTRLIRQTGTPHVGLILDSCHCYCTGDDMATAIMAHADILRGVQLADMPGRVEPGGGIIDFAPIMAALQAIGWKGLVEAEFMPSVLGRAGELAAVAGLGELG